MGVAFKMLTVVHTVHLCTGEGTDFVKVGWTDRTKECHLLYNTFNMTYQFEQNRFGLT